MKVKILFFLLLQAVSINALYATDVPAGTVKGTWTKANSPYKVKGDITVSSNDKLIIEPGVEVIFEGLYKLQVNGVLEAIGSTSDSITFTADDKQVGWGGIRFDNSASGANGAMSNNDSSFISFCRLEYGIVKTSWPDNSGGAIFAASFPQLKISNSIFENNESLKGGAIYIQDGGFIDSCSFVNNICSGSGSGGAIYIKTLGAVHNSTFVGNEAYYGGALLLTASGGTADGFATAFNCKMYDNKGTQGGAVRSYKGSLINCVIANNSASEGGGIRVEQTKVINSTVVKNSGTTSGNYLLKENTVANSIFWGNNASSDKNQISTSDTTMVVKYCAVEGGYTGAGAQSGIVGLSANNNDAVFKMPTSFDGISAGDATKRNDILSSDWYIEKGSLCIDAGENFSFPPNMSGDIMGANRIYNNKIDIGAYEYAPDTTTSVANVELAGVSIYPTVFANNTMVHNATQKALNIHVFDMSGTVVNTLNTSDAAISLDLSAYSAGLYVVRVLSGTEYAIFKVIKK